MVEAGPADTFACITGWGVAGDSNAHRLSPRQILLTLQSELETLNIAPGALRENIVISIDEPQAFRPGTRIITDKGVEIDLTMYCEPCQQILPIVRDLGSMIQRRGVLGYIRQGGEITQGDGIMLVADHHAPLPESPYQRFLDFVPRIPAGKVVRYRDLAIAIGVADSFVRALPGYIKRSADNQLPLHRIVNARGELLSYVPGHAATLSREGVQVEFDRANTARAWVQLERYLWLG